MADSPTPVASHHNSIREKITLDRVQSGDFEGQLVLTVHDDPPSRAKAPILLDEGTMRFLLLQIAKVAPFKAIRLLEDDG